METSSRDKKVWRPSSRVSTSSPSVPGRKQKTSPYSSHWQPSLFSNVSKITCECPLFLFYFNTFFFRRKSLKCVLGQREPGITHDAFGLVLFLCLRLLGTVMITYFRQLWSKIFSCSLVCCEGGADGCSGSWGERFTSIAEVALTTKRVWTGAGCRGCEIGRRVGSSTLWVSPGGAL